MFINFNDPIAMSISKPEDTEALKESDIDNEDQHKLPEVIEEVVESNSAH